MCFQARAPSYHLSMWTILGRPVATSVAGVRLTFVSAVFQYTHLTLTAVEDRLQDRSMTRVTLVTVSRPAVWDQALGKVCKANHCRGVLRCEPPAAVDTLVKKKKEKRLGGGGCNRLDTSRWLPTRYISSSTICLKCEMCQSQARHTKAKFETTIVGAMEQLGGYRAKSLSCPPILGPPQRYHGPAHTGRPDRPCKSARLYWTITVCQGLHIFLISGGQPCSSGQGARSAVASAANASGAVGGS